MPNIVREDKDALNAVVTVTLEKNDYEPSFNSELKKYQQGASMKGFRKGKTPLSVVRKMFGKNVLAEIINRSFQQELDNYIRDENIQLLGSPLPSEEQDLLDFDLKNLDEYVLSFDLGLAPAFELQGLENDPPLTKWIPSIPDETIRQEIESLQYRAGKSEPTEEAIEEGDIVKFTGVELEEDQPKEGGLEVEFSVSTSAITASAKKEILGQKVGATLNLDLLELEENSTEEFVRNYYLELDKEDDRQVQYTFSLTIAEVTRLTPAELDQTFFDANFGEDEVHSEEEAEEKIREGMVAHYIRQSEGLLYRDMQESLMAANSLEFPEAFLKRWLTFSQEEMTQERAEAEYPEFAKSLQWTLIQEKLTQQFELEVTEEMIRDRIKQQVQGYFGGQADENILESMADRLMQDQEQVRRIANEAMSDLLFTELEQAMNVKEETIPLEELNEKITEAQTAAQAIRNTAKEEEE